MNDRDRCRGRLRSCQPLRHIRRLRYRLGYKEPPIGKLLTYGESNGHMTDDVMWPRKVKLMIPIRSNPNIRKQLEMLLATIA